MNILIINGSPQKDGLLSTLVNAVNEGIPDHHPIDRIDLHDLQERTCEDCLRCRVDGRCLLTKDDARMIAEKISFADALVVGAPSYCVNMREQLRIVFEQSVPGLLSEPSLSLPVSTGIDKKAIIVTTCSTAPLWDFLSKETQGTIEQVAKILWIGGYSVVATVTKSGVKSHTKPEPALLNRARRAAQILCT
jgi:hypothetical protein